MGNHILTQEDSLPVFATILQQYILFPGWEDKWAFVEKRSRIPATIDAKGRLAVFLSALGRVLNALAEKRYSNIIVSSREIIYPQNLARSSYLNQQQIDCLAGEIPPALPYWGNGEEVPAAPSSGGSVGPRCPCRSTQGRDWPRAEPRWLGSQSILKTWQLCAWETAHCGHRSKDAN